ncbi:unnamed protein product [Schistosoma mattheei]|uniref:Ion_trans domain-containing protein n=1 Tax=Schistosoma mattheei TaxID=31246 RepID=A0A3P8FF38_9TREM|nr:unnamed protein product [Schistosoma mattheei]
MALFTVVVAGFAILQWVTAYQSTASLNPLTNLFTVFKALQLAYFQVFGEYEMNTLSGEVLLDSCKNDKINCPGGWSTWLSPILLGVYVILTQVLLLNLVIAMFASTYMRIESASTKYWALQRYHIVGEYVNRSPIPPPLNIIWYIYLIIRYLIRGCRKSPLKSDHPFKKSYECGSSQELRLIHWERLRFWDYDRYIIQGKKRKQKETGKMVSVRTTVMQMNRGAEMSSEIAAAISTYYHTTQDHLARVESKADRLKIVEEKVDKVLSLIKELNLKVFCYYYYYYYFVRIFGYNEIYIIYYLTNVYWFRNVTITYNHLVQSWIVKDFYSLHKDHVLFSTRQLPFVI